MLRQRKIHLMEKFKVFIRNTNLFELNLYTILFSFKIIKFFNIYYKVSNNLQYKQLKLLLLKIFSKTIFMKIFLFQKFK